MGVAMAQRSCAATALPSFVCSWEAIVIILHHSIAKQWLMEEGCRAHGCSTCHSVLQGGHIRVRTEPCCPQLPWRCCSSAAICTHFPISGGWVCRVGVPHINLHRPTLGLGTAGQSQSDLNYTWLASKNAKHGQKKSL